MKSHRDVIVDQFTRQAEPFSRAALVRSDEFLDRIVRAAEAGADDTVLDVACGPGLLVGAFARVVRHATGIDLTPAMLDRARELQRERGLANVSWDRGNGQQLPYGDGQFSIVTSRFAFHHFPDPLAVLREMRRVCRPGGRIVVADSSPAADKAEAFNAMERLRDPSHVRALPPDELRALFAAAGMPAARVENFRLPGDLDDLLARSFPGEGDAGRIRGMFEASLADDAMDTATRREGGRIAYAFPIAIVAAVG